MRVKATTLTTRNKAIRKTSSWLMETEKRTAQIFAGLGFSGPCFSTAKGLLCSDGVTTDDAAQVFDEGQGQGSLRPRGQA